MHGKLDEDGVLGISPLSAISGSVTQQTEARKWNIALMKNGAKPSAVVMDQNVMTEGQFRSFVSRLNANNSGNSAGKIMVLDGGKTVDFAGFSARDMDYATNITASAREIAVGLKVPPEMMGDSANKTYSNMQEASKAFATQTVLPTAQRIYSAISHTLCPMLGFDGSLGIDPSQIDGMRGDEATMLSALEACHFMTTNEKRQRMGLPPMSEGGDVVLVPSGSIPLSESETEIGKLVGGSDALRP